MGNKQEVDESVDAIAALEMLDQAEAVLFDLDGCIYFGNRIAPGAKAVLERLQRKGKQVRFVTNNSTDTGAQVALRLSEMGLEEDRLHVLTATELVGLHLLERHGSMAMKVVGSESLQQSLVRHGHRLIPLSSGRRADAVVIGRDLTFDYAKLQMIVEELDRGTPVIATNPDLYHPGSRGEKVLETGALYKPAEEITGRAVEYFGKPAPHMFHMAMRQCGVTRPEACVMVGDNLLTDIAGGRASGIRTLWLCGAANVASAAALSGTGTVRASVTADAGGLADYAVADLNVIARCC